MIGVGSTKRPRSMEKILVTNVVRRCGLDAVGSAIRAKMRASTRHRAEGFDVSNTCNHHVSCHGYARLRPSRTASATNPLSLRMPQDLEPLRQDTARQPAVRAEQATPVVAQNRRSNFSDPMTGNLSSTQFTGLAP